METLIKLPEDVISFLENYDDPDASQGSWMQTLMDAVEHWNALHGTSLDPYETFILFVQSKSTAESL